ncbi:MAG: 4Fe-4S dicluster domain-containing protein [Bacteroidota bacterium]|nr:4Fe-4S dicluster domain-containing protein [Bacteroidota bacterium]
MKRTLIKIDDQTCNGCGNCVKGCHEGALQLINGKAVMVSELYCDGLGACIGDCPVNAITLEEREAEPYNEVAVMERISVKGNDVIVAHLNHLKNHGEKKLLQEGVAWLKEKAIEIDLSSLYKQEKLDCGCSGSHERSWDEPAASIGAGLSQPPIYEACHVPESSGLQSVRPAFASKTGPAATTLAAGQPSELRQFPVQLHLLNPQAPYFEGADVLLAADCTAFTLGNFHSQFLKGKKLAIACPKLDSDTGHYVDKLESMIDDSNIDTLTVLIMEVPCCSGLVGIAKKARDKASRNIPIKVIVVSVKGEILSQEWI